MTPADCITFDGDTAWLVVAGDPGEYSRMHDNDRPCDTCGGTKLRHVASPDGREVYAGPGSCPDCIDGRHTFDIEVVAYHGRYDDRPSVYFDTYRVSIVPGRVLPIVAASHADGVHGPHLCIQPGGVVLLHHTSFHVVDAPPAAAPGMWAVQLKVTTP